MLQKNKVSSNFNLSGCSNLQQVSSDGGRVFLQFFFFDDVDDRQSDGAGNGVPAEGIEILDPSPGETVNQSGYEEG